MAREHGEQGGLPIVPILVVGGIGYYLYHSGFFSGLTNMFSPASIPVIPNEPASNIDKGITPPTVSNTLAKTPPVVHTLDITGLVVTPDVNGAFTGVVKIDGVPTKLSIISSDGRIFSVAGQEVTADLIAKGIDVSLLRTAFLTGGAAFTTNLAKCMQPNIFDKNGVCVDPFTLNAVPDTMSQTQQNTGVAGVAGLKGLGQIFNWDDFFTSQDMQPRRKHLTGNFR